MVLAAMSDAVWLRDRISFDIDWEWFGYLFLV